MADRWITVPNWERFQHYGNRAPVWIKNYTALLHKDAYLDLTLAERGLLHGIWLVYAERRGHVRAGADLAAELHGRVREQPLTSLSQAGFVGFSASRPLHLRTTSVDARPREDSTAKRRRAAEHFLDNGAAAQIPESQLAEALAEDYHLPPDIVADLLGRRS